MKILAVDTSCDETAAAVTQGTTVLSNVVWSQASLHAKFGGVLPSLAQRAHEEHIDWVVKKALGKHKVDAVAVTAGPGLAIALGVGIKKARELASVWKKPLLAVNHIEGHVLSPMATSKSGRMEEQESVSIPALGLVVSGKHTELIYVEEIGKYRIIAETVDDALGEALDKAARMLGLGYPGGAILEKLARRGNPKIYPLPLPMAGRENRNEFSYSGLKTAMWRLVKQLGGDPSTSSGLAADQIFDLAAAFQNRAFEHLVRVTAQGVRAGGWKSVSNLLVGGGVAANVELRKRLRKLGKELGLEVRFPYSTKLYGDNAAMIGVAAGFRATKDGFSDLGSVDRRPRWKIDS